MIERPNPDKLLAKYEPKSQTGKLTIFLGAAAGVGKTSAMLKAIPELVKDGVDVVIGYVETHKRKETHDLLPDNIEVLPMLELDRKGHKLFELNLDAIIKRKPQLVIIDELAHSNVSGSRNAKRYQDVLEILDHGIDVYTALNIQHIESLNDVVGQITGINVNETVPDSVLENAHEIKLIDVTPDELIERLKDGKIYQQDRAVAALKNFFRKGNLTALREMALLKTAQKVQDQVQEYRAEKSINEVWASHENLLVVLEPGYSSEKIIRSGKTMFDKGFSRWFVVYIDDGKFDEKPLREKEKLLNLLELAKQLGAESLQLIGTNPTETIINFARQNNINTIVLSQYRLSLYYRLFGTTLIAKLTELAPELNLHLVRDEFSYNKADLTFNSVKPKQKLDIYKTVVKIVRSSIIFGLLGGGLYPLTRYISNENILMIYLLVIILSNHGRGKVSAVIAALIATVSFDFFFIPPRLSFAIGDFQYGITFIVMAGLGIAFSIVNGNLRFQVGKLAKAQLQMRLVYDASKSLAEAMVEEQVISTVGEFFPQLSRVSYALLLPSLNEEISPKIDLLGDSLDIAIAKWVFDNGKPAGLKTNTFAASKIFYLPVNSKIRTRGVIAILPHDEMDFFLPEQQTLLNSFASNLATTLERIHFTQIAIQTEILLLQKDKK